MTQKTQELDSSESAINSTDSATRTEAGRTLMDFVLRTMADDDRTRAKTTTDSSTDSSSNDWQFFKPDGTPLQPGESNGSDANGFVIGTLNDGPVYHN